ncbi:hypothetical protein, partial [Proteus mirabilis]|uniref:hypothetical protein n=1 Tax=Proteus mirabilis TaxID=584 RepID=UPI0034E6172E
IQYKSKTDFSSFFLFVLNEIYIVNRDIQIAMNASKSDVEKDGFSFKSFKFNEILTESCIL